MLWWRQVTRFEDALLRITDLDTCNYEVAVDLV